MSDHQSRTASDDVYDHEREDPRSGRRRRPVADWGVGEGMFEDLPRNRSPPAAPAPAAGRAAPGRGGGVFGAPPPRPRFRRAPKAPPRARRFASRAAEAD